MLLYLYLNAFKAGILTLLDEPDIELKVRMGESFANYILLNFFCIFNSSFFSKPRFFKVFALERLNDVVNDFWPEISERIETMYVHIYLYIYWFFFEPYNVNCSLKRL